MNQNLTELVFILDRSGSMGGLESDTVGGFNAMLLKQKETGGQVNVTTVLFDDVAELLHDRIPLAGVAPLTEKEYFVRGSTALLDAVGGTIHKLANVQKNTSEDQRAGKVIVVITTDGMENASREYSYKRVQRMITKETEKYGWEFIFLGANLDAVGEAGRLGIKASRAARFVNDGEGIRRNYAAVSAMVCEVREGNMVSEDWKRDIEEDFCRRGN